METIFIFLLKASAGIILFYMVYWLFLRKETFYAANRWFLILTLLCAVLFPLFPIEYTILAEQESNATTFQTIADTFQNIPVIAELGTEESSFNWQQALLLIYLTGAAIFLLRLISQTFILVHLMIKYRIKPLNGVRIVENEKYGLPFSFFNIIFINPKFHKQEDLPEILAHEKVHIRENHWFDLLFIELLTVIFWFNPFIWFFERSIKLNHEYLADKGVLLQGHNTGRYQAILLNQLMGMQIIGITSNLNFALNTNRLKMMTKKKTSRILGIKFVWTLPVLALLLFAFAEPSYRVEEHNSNDSGISIREMSDDNSISNTKTLLKQELTINGKILYNETKEPLPGATILLNGTAIGTVSDRDGTFKLVDPNPKADDQYNGFSSEIVISFVGKKTVKTKFGASRDALVSGLITVLMEDAVVVIDTEIPPPPLPPKGKKATKVPPPTPPVSSIGEKEGFYIVENMPQYPGGLWDLVSYVNKMQKKIAVQEKVKGKAKVAFTIDGKGKVTDVKVVEKDNDEAAKGAYIIASQMKDWSPGKQRGKGVPVKYLLPIEFK